jgi:hypothetical protein
MNAILEMMFMNKMHSNNLTFYIST